MPAIDANVDDSSDDGTRVFFNTAEPLVTADTDTRTDLYERSGGVTTLVSTGPTGGNGAFDAQFQDVVQGRPAGLLRDRRAPDLGRHGQQSRRVRAGRRRHDSRLDRARWAAMTLRTPSSAGISQDGLHVYFVAYESLVAEDQDSDRKDVYERYGRRHVARVDGTPERKRAAGSRLRRLDARRLERLLPHRRRAHGRRTPTACATSTSGSRARPPSSRPPPTAPTGRGRPSSTASAASGSPVFFDTSESLARVRHRQLPRRLPARGRRDRARLDRAVGRQRPLRLELLGELRRREPGVLRHARPAGRIRHRRPVR